MDEYNPEADVAKEEKARKLAQRKDKDDVKWLMGNEIGRRIVWSLLDSAGIYRSSFSTDTHVTAFQEGKRNYGIELIARIHKHCPKEFNLMTQEHKSDAVDAAMAEFL